MRVQPWIPMVIALVARTLLPLPAAAEPATSAVHVDSLPAEVLPVDSTAVLRTESHFDHAAWSRLLTAYVDDQGRVAYKTWVEKDQPALRAYLDAVGAARPSTWPRDEQIAFWINSYNAGMVWAVMHGQSAETLIGRARLFKSWKFRAAGENRTPDSIEHTILRKQFQEARIHFALVCASAGCPPLRRNAYSADSLVLQLDDQARRFINDPTRNVIDADAKKLELSSIFDWFRTDFEHAAGSVPRFLARYVHDSAAHDWLLAGAIPLTFRDYNWALNQQPFQRPEHRKLGGKGTQ